MVDFRAPLRAKLLALALHPSTPVPEAEAAILRWLSLSRAAGVASIPDPLPPAPSADWRAAMPRPSGRRRYDAAADDTPVLSFGKYRGQTVRQVFHHTPGYLVWCLYNLALTASVRAAMLALVGADRPDLAGRSRMSGHPHEHPPGHPRESDDENPQESPRNREVPENPRGHPRARADIRASARTSELPDSRIQNPKSAWDSLHADTAYDDAPPF
jgi:hypothetical protein